jgi:hypothetical protein
MPGGRRAGALLARRAAERREHVPDAMQPPIAFSRRGFQVIRILAVASAAAWTAAIWGLVRLLT